MIPDEEVITWFKPDTEVFEVAAKHEMVIVLFFPEEGVDPIDASKQLHDEELAKLSEDNVMFVMIPFNADRTPSFDDGSPIPTSRLLSPNPSRDYDITRNPTYIVCDHFGNEYDRHTRTPSARKLKRSIDDVSDMMEKFNEKLQKNVEDMKEALEDKELKKFFKAALKNFKFGVVGLEAQEETIKLYRKQIDDARERIDQILEDRPDDGQDTLKSMSRDFRDTELKDEIDDAISILKGR